MPRRYSTDYLNDDPSPIDKGKRGTKIHSKTHRNSEVNVTLGRMNIMALEQIEEELNRSN